jgi:hypothetical protein
MAIEMGGRHEAIQRDDDRTVQIAGFRWAEHGNEASSVSGHRPGSECRPARRQPALVLLKSTGLPARSLVSLFQQAGVVLGTRSSRNRGYGKFRD